MLSGCCHSKAIEYMKKRQQDQHSLLQSFVHDVSFTQENSNIKHSIVNAELKRKSKKNVDKYLGNDKTQDQQQNLFPSHLQYEIVKNLDMYGPDLESIWVPDRKAGIAKAIDLIENNPNLCVVLAHQMDCILYLKKIMQCEPFDARSHSTRETIFLKSQKDQAIDNKRCEQTIKNINKDTLVKNKELNRFKSNE